MVTEKLNEPNAPDDGSADAGRVDGATARMIDQKIQVALADALEPIFERIIDLERQVEAMMYREG